LYDGPVLSPEELRARADALGWFHRIDLGHGVVTNGLSSGPYVGPDKMPDLSGKTVLDIGAWDGFYSFQAERLGAARVVALDHYVWGVDMGARQVYWAECEKAGILPDHNRDTTDFWRPELPGRQAFDFAKVALDSKVEPMLADFALADLSSVGRFDVVLYLGVLYHMKEPLSVLERLRSLTKEVAVIETQAVQVAGMEEQNLTQFFGGEFIGDYGNWYVPTMSCLRQWAMAAGFSRVVPVVEPRPVHTSATTRLRRRVGSPPATGPTSHPNLTYYRAVVHAYA
jgi:tRNA (mo5U34)-methyltransferase